MAVSLVPTRPVRAVRLVSAVSTRPVTAVRLVSVVSTRPVTAVRLVLVVSMRVLAAVTSVLVASIRVLAAPIAVALVVTRPSTVLSWATFTASVSAVPAARFVSWRSLPALPMERVLSRLATELAPSAMLLVVVPREASSLPSLAPSTARYGLAPPGGIAPIASLSWSRLTASVPAVPVATLDRRTASVAPVPPRLTRFLSAAS